MEGQQPLIHLNTRIVMPLLPAANAPKAAKLLNPTLAIGGEACVRATQFLASVPPRLLGDEVANLQDEALTIVSALDGLLQRV